MKNVYLYFILAQGKFVTSTPLPKTNFHTNAAYKTRKEKFKSPVNNPTMKSPKTSNSQDITLTSVPKLNKVIRAFQYLVMLYTYFQGLESNLIKIRLCIVEIDKDTEEILR